MTKEILTSIHSLIEEKSLLKHPFYVKWTKGELTLDDMKIYAKEYYHLARAVPEIVTLILEHVPTEETIMRQHMLHNMEEEREHVVLWERFAASMGITKVELETYEPTETVKKAVNDLKALAKQSLSSGIIAMYAFEAELPKIAETKKAGLSAFYGLTSSDAQCYFDAHLLEEEHLKVWRAIPVDASEAVIAASRSLSAQNRVLDGVCERAAIQMAC